jgi:uncharacterized sulfatase
MKDLNRRGFVKTAGTVAAGVAAQSLIGQVFAQGQKRPNFLWISTEDIGPMHGCYGDPVAVTPAIDQLAAEGVRYTNAYTCAGVCSPSRYSIITGRYPTSDGTQHMRSGISSQGPLNYYTKLPEGVRFFTSYLRDAGYYCTNNSKQDYQVDTPPDAWDVSGRSAHWRNRTDASQPFFHVVNFTTTHESRTHRLGPPVSRARSQGLTAEDVHGLPIQDRGQLPESRRVDPADVVVPPYYPDTPDVRQLIAQNYDNVSTMDMQCEAVVRQLEEDGLAEDTVVFYWSDHGGPLARGKRTIYDSGIHVPLIVRIPEKFRVGGQGTPGSVDTHMMSFIDFAPTMLNLAGLAVPSFIQGRSFLGPNLGQERHYIYAARDRMDERYDTVRAVRDKRFKYIRNYQPHKPLYQYIDYAERGPIQKEIRRLGAEGSLPAAAAAMLSPTKTAEELYDLEADPHEINNLADSDDHRDTLDRLRAAHEAWVVDTRDTGLLPEPVMIDELDTVGSANAILAGASGLSRLKEIRNTADAARRGDGKTLLAALANGDAAVRYWGAVGLGLGSGDVPEALRRAMSDASASVRVAAAQSVARLGDPKSAKAVLLESLKDEDPWIRLMAVVAIDETDTIATTVLDDLRPYREDESKYVARVANRILNRIEGTSERVR